MPDIVILTARFGNGHLSAATNIAAALARDFPSLSVEIVDPFQLTKPRPYQQVQRIYRLAQRRSPLLWHLFFRLADRTPLGRWWVLSNRPLRRFFRDFPAAYRPKAVLNTYAVFPTVLGQYHGRGEPAPFRLATVLTDSISINRTWLEGPSELFLVSDELTAHAVAGQGVAAEKIVVTGFPTPIQFEHGTPVRTGPRSPGDPVSILWIADLDRGPLVLLLDRLGACSELRLVLAVGRRPKLAEALRAAAPRWRFALEVIEWEPGISARMPGMDLVITKAGGATVHEALAAGCPVLISRVTPGQEEGNARLVEANGLGRVARGARDLGRILGELEADRFAALEPMRERVARFRRPGAAAHIARLAAAMADGESVSR
jgi:processive 1,2-diacylglycerol beta-glucosyltransferase